MITDQMSKYEVMASLRKEFDDEVLPYYRKLEKSALYKSLKQQCERTKKTINKTHLFQTKNLTCFKILQRASIECPQPFFVCEFWWNNRFCYGCFFPEGNVVVYQQHSLQRYAERVLQDENLPTMDVFYKHIVKSQDAAFRIVLPTPTHRYSYYYGIADALFLGDYDDNHLDDNFIWCNTCISYTETKYSQLRITKSLHQIKDFVKKVKYDFAEPQNEEFLQQYLKKFENDNDRIEELKSFLTKKYLLWKLHLSFNFHFTEHFRSGIDKTVPYLEQLLESLNVAPKSLSPYSKSHGIAWKGEIDYKD